MALAPRTCVAGAAADGVAEVITLFKVLENAGAAVDAVDAVAAGCSLLLLLALLSMAAAARNSEVAVTESMPRRHITYTGTPPLPTALG